MPRPFAAAKVGDLMWPEVIAVTGLIAGHILARGIDASAGWNRPMRRVSDYVHLGALGGSAYCVATDRAPDAMKAVLYADAGIVGTILGDVFYERLVAPGIGKVRSKTEAERLAQARARTPAQQLMIAEAAATAQGARQPVGAGSILEI